MSEPTTAPAPAAPATPPPAAPATTGAAPNRAGLDVSEMVTQFTSLMKGDPPAKKAATQPIAPPDPAPTPTQPPAPEPTPAPTPSPEPPKAAEPPKTADNPNDFKAPDPAKVDVSKEPKPGSKDWNMAQMKKSLEEHTKARADLEKQLAELQKQVKTTPPELNELKAELEKYQTIVERTALADDPRFQAAFDQRIDAFVKESVASVDAEKQKTVEDILRMSPSATRDKALREASEELDDFSRTAVLTNYMHQKNLEKERASQLANSRENLKKMRDMAKTQELERGQQMQSLVELELSRASQVWPEFADREGDADHNATAAQNRQMAKDFLRAVESPKDLANLMVWAARGKVGLENEARLMALVQQHAATIRELQGAQPSLEGNQGGMTPTRPSGSAPMSQVTGEFLAEFEALQKR